MRYLGIYTSFLTDSFNRPRISINAILIFFIIVLHAFYSLYYFIDRALALRFYSFTYYYILGLIIFYFITQISKVKIYNFHLPFIIFSFYCAVNSIIRKEPDILYFLMFLFWSLYIQVIFPLFYRSRRKEIYTMVRNLVIFLTLFLLFLPIYSIFNNIPLFRIDYVALTGIPRVRFTSGLANPIYYSRLLLTLLWISLLAYILFTSKFYLFISTLAGIILILTDARTAIYVSIFSIVLYMLSANGVTKKRMLSYLIFSFISIILLLSLSYLVTRDYINYTQLNSLLSGRLDAWTDAIRRTYENSIVLVFLFGSGRNIWETDFSNQIVAPHYDNLYLEILLKYGIIGFILLFYSFYNIVLLLNNKIKNECDIKRRKVFIWAKSVVFLILFMGLSDVVIPSLGNSVNIVLLPLAINAINWIQLLSEEVTNGVQKES